MNLDLSILCTYAISLSFLSNLHAHKHKHTFHAGILEFLLPLLLYCTPGNLMASFCTYVPLFPLLLNMFEKRTHTRSLPRTPPLAHGASALGENVGRKCLCLLDLNWPVLNSGLQRMTCGNKQEEVRLQQYVVPIIY